jgi:hypothetical protein
MKYFLRLPFGRCLVIGVTLYYNCKGKLSKIKPFVNIQIVSEML